MKTEDAINQLTKALKNEAYRETWEANIAMSFYKIATKAANRFIDLLIKK